MARALFLDEATVGSLLDHIDTYVEVEHMKLCCRVFIGHVALLDL